MFIHTHIMRNIIFYCMYNMAPYAKSYLSIILQFIFAIIEITKNTRKILFPKTIITKFCKSVQKYNNDSTSFLGLFLNYKKKGILVFCTNKNHVPPFNSCPIHVKYIIIWFCHWQMGPTIQCLYVGVVRHDSMV